MNRDISSEIHAQLDAAMKKKMATLLGYIPGYIPDPIILSSLLVGCTAAYAALWPIDQQWGDIVACGELLTSRSDIQALLENARATGRYAPIRSLRMWLGVYPSYCSLFASRFSYEGGTIWSETICLFHGWKAVCHFSSDYLLDPHFFISKLEIDGTTFKNLPFLIHTYVRFPSPTQSIREAV
jgi:hypothetical protein